MSHSLADLFRDVAACGVAVEIWKLDMLEKGGEIIEKEAKDVIGTYRYNWPQLASIATTGHPSTQEERVRLGYPPNEPLLREGNLRDSIEHTVIPQESAVEIGSNNPIAKYQELGTNRIPPRSFLGGAARAKETELHEEVARGFHLEIMSGLRLAHKP